MVSNITNVSDFLTFYESNIWRDGPEIIPDLLQILNDLEDVPNTERIRQNLCAVFDSHSNEMDGEIINGIEWIDFVEQHGSGIETNDYELSRYCTLLPRNIQKVKKFNATGTSYIVKFKNLHEISDLEELLEKVFRRIIELTDVANDGLIGFEMRHRSLDTPILIPFVKKAEMTPEHISRTICNVVQSNQQLDLESGLECQVTELSLPFGLGWSCMQYNGDWGKFLEKHKSIWNVDPDDGLCLPRAIGLSIGYLENDPKISQLRQHKKSPLQKERAVSLMKEAGLQDHTGAWGIEQLQQFQACLAPDYQIKVFEKPNCSEIVFDGPSAPKQLNLLLVNGHYMVISKILAFLNTSYWCPACNICFSLRSMHKRCPITCGRCLGSGKCDETNQRHCQICNRWFVSTKCYKRHLSNQNEGNSKKRRILSICEQLKRCTSCSVEYYHSRKHCCQSVYCSLCRRSVSKAGNHQCFMAKYVRRPDHKSCFVFFDFETEQSSTVVETRDVGDTMLHRVICAVAHKVCNLCWKENDMQIHCTTCGQRRMVFSGASSLTDFIRWLFSENNRGCIAMAHNGKSFDFQFILEKLNHQAATTPEIICKGLEIIKLTASGVTLLDSINFLPMPLAAMPKAFNLSELKKGFFPHLFSTLDRFNYDGEYPDAYFYSPATMKVEKKKDFFDWYLKAKKGRFHFYNELIAYCNSDVDILKRAAMTFRADFIETNGLDPFSNAITVADACNKVFRMSYLQPNSIGLIPAGEYRLEEKYSNMAIKWLRWISHTQNLKIEHACNGKEFRIANTRTGKSYRVDGRCGSTVFEYNGCAYHGCTSCFKPNQFLPLSGQLVRESYQKTLDRQRYLESQGYLVETKWECSLKMELRSNPEMRQFFKDQITVETMKARDAYFGGRTNVIKLHHRVSDGERIEYIDICSLYPYICKYGIFPCGHPEIITENFDDLSGRPYQGLINCLVLPPSKLFHPVLPNRIRGKLMFPLCKTCAELGLSTPCKHNDEERAFWGSFVTLELYKALEMGYRVLRISEVWHYKATQQYTTQNKEGIFVGYINNFLLLKQENSDWPQWCQTEADRAKYLADYMEHENIQLNPENIKKNGAKRALAKLCLNALYGKFGQHSNKPKSKYITSPSEFYTLIHDSTKTVKSIQFISDNKVNNSQTNPFLNTLILQVFVNYIQTEGFEEAGGNTNVVIAAYVTAQARLKLYTYLEQLQNRVLYMDTDSVVYLSTPDSPKIGTGDYLGDMTNELSGYGSDAHIVEWVSCGPKNYAFKVLCNGGEDEKKHYKYVVKIKGFTLDSITGKRLNMQTMKRKVAEFVLAEGSVPSTDVVHFSIDRTTEQRVLTRPKKRSYNLVIDKRFCTRDYNSYPFGYFIQE